MIAIAWVTKHTCSTDSVDWLVCLQPKPPRPTTTTPIRTITRVVTYLPQPPPIPQQQWVSAWSSVCCKRTRDCEPSHHVFPLFLPSSLSLSLSLSLFSETGIGGVKTYRTPEGGGLAPKVAPRKLGLLAPKLAIFYRVSVEKGQIQGPLKIQYFHPPSNFRRFGPPYPGLQSLSLFLRLAFFLSLSLSLLPLSLSTPFLFPSLSHSLSLYSPSLPPLSLPLHLSFCPSLGQSASSRPPQHYWVDQKGCSFSPVILISHLVRSILIMYLGKGEQTSLSCYLRAQESFS